MKKSNIKIEVWTKERGHEIFDGLTSSDFSKYLSKEFGTLHREDGPAFLKTKVSRTGEKKQLELWYNENRLHNQYGPASIIYDIVSGKPRSIKYYNEGLFHREDGLAVIERDKNGKEYGDFYFMGEKLSEEDWTNIVRESKFELI